MNVKKITQGFKHQSVFKYFIHTLVACACCLISACYTSGIQDLYGEKHPTEESRLAASPEMLIEKFYTDRENAFRYVNRQNANTILRADENYTILHAAAFERTKSLILALIENGADAGAKARWKYVSGGYSDYVRTPASCALMWNNREIAKYLADHSGEDYNKLIVESEAKTKEAHARARSDGFRAMKEVIELDRKLNY